MALSAQDPLASGNNDVIRIRDRIQNSPEIASSRAPSILINHYYLIAYTIVIGAYVFAFGEYLYFRLTSIIFPEKVIYHSLCDKKHSEVVGKDALHYAIIIVAFCSVAFFQIICFFGLTISEKWTICTLPDIDNIAHLRHKLAKHIKNTMNNTVYPTFMIVWAVIFYMIGVRDSVDAVVSSVSLYVFDVVLFTYFVSFPVIVYIYHPFARKSAAMLFARMHNTSNDINNNERSPGGNNRLSVQELRADRSLVVSLNARSPPLASPELSLSPTPRVLSDSHLLPLSSRLYTYNNTNCNIDEHDYYSLQQSQFRRNVRITTTV
ncbi:unnamed protein product [Anisakis simplex]|uniref:G_PROTEIN_RECEP_F1_2 domain-containing protein n=1 Tax=Anisakis simplex TaxID=6269 RepID=A0A0M3JSH4_ANISI|nr:unnamed protein product [Anisakis simplex]